LLSEMLSISSVKAYAVSAYFLLLII